MSVGDQHILVSQEQDLPSLQNAVLMAVRSGGGMVDVLVDGTQVATTIVVSPEVPVAFEVTDAADAALAGTAEVAGSDLDPDDYYHSRGRVSLESRSSGWAEWREDVARYRAHYGGSLVRPLLLEQAIWVLLGYRLTSAIYRSSRLGPLKAPLLLLGVMGQKLNESIAGISIPYAADIAPGLYIGHFGPTVINPGAVIGPGCNLSQGVTIGVSGRGDKRGVPRLGARIYVGANATVAGDIEIGDDVMIGANSLVTRSVPAGSTVVGVPAKVVDQRGTTGMGLHQRPSTAG
jgi:serine O-acetyltransferase